MRYKKLSADCENKLMNMVVKASKKERRTLSNFVRIACEERAKKILKKKDG